MYSRLLLDFDQRENDRLPLAPEQQHYLKNVLRLRTDDLFLALDGKGKTWLARIVDNRAHLVEERVESNELPVPVTLMVAVPKNGFEDVVRASTELGVARIVPLLTRRGLGEQGARKVERWRKIAIEAVEQSERQILPAIEEPREFLELLETRSKIQTISFICVTRKKADPLLSRLPEREPGEIAVAIGPEGGWTDEEIEGALAADFRAVSLGKRILRTITAPLVALSLINVYLEEQSKLS